MLTVLSGRPLYMIKSYRGYQVSNVDFHSLESLKELLPPCSIRMRRPPTFEGREKRGSWVSNETSPYSDFSFDPIYHI